MTDKLIVILGPTATGKTGLAAHLAKNIGGEIISADSRQVYKNLDIGSGKDLKDYIVEGFPVPYHLVDIVELPHEYNVFQYQEDFHKAYDTILRKKKPVVLCGGTGLYIQAVLDNYKLYPVPKNDELRNNLQSKSIEELSAQLKCLTKVHNKTDTETKNRAIRAIEIALYCEENDIQQKEYPPLNPIIFGISLERKIVKERITARLHERLKEGMIEEVEGLIKTGISIEKLKFLGLEYKFLAEYLNGETEYDEMVEKLNIAIHQFSKRQMTWFRRMEKQGHQIHWVNGLLSMEEKVAFIKSRIADS